MPRRRSDRLLVEVSPRRDIMTAGGVQAFVVVVAVNARPAMPAMGTPAMRNGFMRLCCLHRAVLSIRKTFPRRRLSHYYPVYDDIITGSSWYALGLSW